MLRTVVFDLGNVLLYFSHEQMCRQIGELCGQSQQEVWRWLFDEHWERDFERGEIDGSEFQRRIEQRSGVTVDRNALIDASSDIFTLNEPIVPLLDELRRLGVRLVLLSNTHPWHVEFVRRRFHVLDRFDELVLSYVVGAVKPDPAVFEATIKALWCSPSEAFYTDDISQYIAAGRQFGLHAEMFTTVPELREHLAELGLDVKMTPA